MRYAEYAAEHWLMYQFGCVVTRRALRSKFQKVDFFHCDVLAKDREGFWYAVQATAGGPQAVYARKKKLERIPWHYSDSVFVAQLTTEQDSKDKRKTVYYLNISEYCGGRVKAWRPSDKPWGLLERVRVPRHWLKPYRAVDNPDAKD